ncbi:LytTR family DNA-binding domain-containing protein [Vallitalea okinawensis]|uniref:LytTR family DNA-binding domain-containing protein n=1 Tax=Vallitalea okinawensis TaxID=2078660 RepID=UPI0013002731|nr:LytTR family DNA-binding domain-containing protein [Vallitalea okinawensis]
MKLDIDIDDKYEETTIVIKTKEITKELEDMIKTIRTSPKKTLVGKSKEKLYIINPDEIYRMYGESQKVLTETENGIYELSHKLYELEEQFKDTSFVRVSKSAIVNFDKVKNMEMFFNGTMCVNFDNGKQEFISRRYVSKIKQYLGMGGK